MRGMILAAGFGTRLRPLTDRIPKPIVDVAGRPLIAYAIDVLRSAGIEEIIVNLHHLGDRIEATLGDGSDYGVALTYSREETILDTGGGIRRARPFLESGRFAVINADTVIDLDLRDVVEKHDQRAALATMVLRPDPQAARFGTIGIDVEGRIRRFLGKPAEVPVPLAELMFTGVHVFEPEVFRFMEREAFSITRDTYPAMLAAGEPLFGHVFNGYWRVLDTHAGLAEGRRDLEGRTRWSRGVPRA